MRRRIVTFVMILICFILQSTLLNILSFGGIKPNLLLVLTVSMGLMRGKHTGLWVGFISGLIIDIFFGNLFGFNALLYMYIGYINGNFYKVFYDEDIKIPMFLVAVSDMAYSLIFYLIQFAFRERFDFSAYFIRIILPELLYTVLFTLILYKLFYIINKKLTANELEENDSPWLLK
jgi:rod shape-determining protein MreD